MLAAPSAPPDDPLLPFGDYFAAAFADAFPDATSRLSPAQLAAAAHSYLFRFDERFSDAFIAAHLATVADALAASLSRPPADQYTLRLVHTFAKDCAHSHFSLRWQDISDFVRVNSPPLEQLVSTNHLLAVLHHYLCTTTPADSDTDPAPLPDLNPVHLNELLNHNVTVLVFVYANYCSLCKRLKPIFECAAALSTPF